MAEEGRVTPAACSGAGERFLAVQKQIGIPAETLIVYRKSLQLIVLLGSLPRKLKKSFRFEQREGLEEEEPGGNKENPPYLA